MPPTLSNTMSRLGILGARGPKSHGTSKMLDNKWERYPMSNFPHPTPQDTRQIFPDPLLAADTSWDSSGNPRILQLPQEVEEPTEIQKKNHNQWRQEGPLFPNFGILGIFSTVSKIIDLSISFCLSEGLDFWIFSSPWQNSKNAKLQLLLDPAQPHQQTSPLRLCLSKISSCWSFRHAGADRFIKFKVDRSTISSWSLESMINLRSLATSFRYVLPSDVLPEFSKLPTTVPNFAGKKKQIWAQPNYWSAKKIHSEKVPTKKQTNHIEKKKSDTFSVFFPHRPRFPPVTFKKPTFPKKKNIILTPQNNWSKKKRKRPTDENYDETTVPPTPWISHPWRPVERLYQYWRCFDHRLQDLLAYLGIQTDESFKNSLETPQKSRGLTEPPQKKKALGVKWNAKLFFFLLTKNWG